LKSNIISQLPFVRARRLVRFRFQGFPLDGPASSYRRASSVDETVLFLIRSQFPERQTT
jgi:hypothetical protein